MKISQNSKDKFAYFAKCEDAKSLSPIPFCEGGVSALECFHSRETFGGALLPCREPELLTRALNGKQWHGLSITMIAEDLLDGLAFAEDIRAGYPEWVQKDIAGRARQLAVSKIGFVPTFVSKLLTAEAVPPPCEQVDFSGIAEKLDLAA